MIQSDKNILEIYLLHYDYIMTGSASVNHIWDKGRLTNLTGYGMSEKRPVYVRDDH